MRTGDALISTVAAMPISAPMHRHARAANARLHQDAVGFIKRRQVWFGQCDPVEGAVGTHRCLCVGFAQPASSSDTVTKLGQNPFTQE